ncbi:SDR family oxidoreductase [Curvibacter sp. APW13]|uniref:SDR family oxidoreductase n=1 Tax=Curvibacter sp. APW13 TaxID=3077236 RepID=UPI0028E064C6|nr:SDR family oxidoreductase [Curvibacter sp. APW13]MDT8989448.1 SDR family oxidoreductase [Curvibacter sp. APW13]
MSTQTILVTGSSGYLGSQVLATLAQRADLRIVGLDVREPTQRLDGVTYAVADIRAVEVDSIVATHRPDVVVHLASIVTPGKDSNRAFEYDVDVNGTRNLLQACVAHGVRRVIVSSSGAAYGYHADNPEWLVETDPVRGNEAFAYSHHKRLVEEMLAEYRAQHPALEQVVFRIGTILGPTVRNQITDLFEKPRLIAIAGSDSPFVFIHDQDVVGAIVHGIDSAQTGIFNVAGDGKLSIHQIAAKLHKQCVVFPAWVLRSALWILKQLHLTQYGPEQLDFLRYRPVLLNTRLKTEFGYTPKLSSAQVFDLYLQARKGQVQ